MLHNIGIVVIGRNEGKHLPQCLLSVINKTNHLVYVDSGSTDNSLDIANSLDVKVISLDPSEPFTAARGRNTGAKYLLETNPEIDFIQFVDGDSYIVDGWLEQASSELDMKKDLAVVCGVLKEKHPELSVYNKLCHLEWSTPGGNVAACGGNMMVRASVFQQIKGFNQTLIAGEDPELCLRLRQQGWKIFKLNHLMGLHDGSMISFVQWWKRLIRGGFAYAEGAWLHGNLSERYRVGESIRIWFWGLFLPLLTIVTLWHTQGLSLILLIIAYTVLLFRVYISMKQKQFASEDAFIYAIFAILDKFPQMLGQIKFYMGILLKSRSKLIEHK